MDKNKIVIISTFPDIQSYGIRILSSMLKERGFKTYLIFLNAPFGSLYSKEVLEQVVEVSKGSLYVGISLMTNFFERAKQVTLFLKENLEIPIVWGGIHTAIKPYECLEYADIICIGESEDIITSLSEGLKSSNEIHQINNIWLNKNGIIIKNKIVPMINDISKLPLPDYDYVNHFVIDRNRVVPMDLIYMEQYMGYEYSTMATRGCFYNCSFCANNFFDKNFDATNTMKIRSRSMEDVIKELIWVKENLNYVRIFKFVDDLFMALPKDTIETFCKLYKESGLGLSLNITGVHPSILREDKFKLLVDVGLQYVRMGIQSGSQNIRKLYGRQETNNKIIEGVKIFHKYKNKLKSIHYDFIVDNPWETLKDIKDSLMLLLQIPKPYIINIFSLTLYPGTELYNKAKNEGILKNENSQVYNKHYHDDAIISYYNGLFRIISTYRLPNQCYIFLIENGSTLLAKIIYFILFGGIDLVVRLQRLIYLIKEGMLDIMNGKFDRINKFIFVRSKVVH